MCLPIYMTGNSVKIWHHESHYDKAVSYVDQPDHPRVKISPSNTFFSSGPLFPFLEDKIMN